MKYQIKSILMSLEIAKNLLNNVINGLKSMTNFDNEIENAFKMSNNNNNVFVHKKDIYEMGKFEQTNNFLKQKQEQIEFLKKCYEIEFNKGV